MATATTGGATSGNSSVLSCHSAAIPNTTSAIITTVGTTGFLIAKSEISMLARRWRDDARARRRRRGDPREDAVAGAETRDQVLVAQRIAQPELDLDALDGGAVDPHHRRRVG